MILIKKSKRDWHRGSRIYGGDNSVYTIYVDLYKQVSIMAQL